MKMNPWMHREMNMNIKKRIRVGSIMVFALTLSASALAQTYMCPDGSYVSRGPCTLCPDGHYVGGSQVCSMAPDGTYVPGRNPAQMAPDGTYHPGGGRIIMCPDGTYVTGSMCVLTPDGHYVGR